MSSNTNNLEAILIELEKPSTKPYPGEKQKRRREARAKLQALISQEAAKARIDELEQPLYFNLSEHSHEQFKAGFEQALKDWEQYRLRRLAALTKGGDTGDSASHSESAEH